ncbi:glycosyltransferase family 2 protein [Luteolibacter yonseiensis]|uniref:Glycosyltransferase family 2 protein n=1 Tax=Luteolibacter yonseiensis TaxID=1144680 RepID=A0A934R805_9BACT|nr:glycosyltransferase family 2 protein [Luteolibacter yonseiensis]MBK1817140.1 glycosyltransferase family 2 protein [Luteolibacter yonseiensis]
MSPLDLTIAIPVRNEERNLPGCLDAIGKGLASRVVILDSGSTDATRQIGLDWGAEVIDFKWNGRFPKKRNWYLRNHRPTTRWVLFLDADEYLTESFKAELPSALEDVGKTGYWLSYSIYFLGRELKAGYPLRKLALFQTGAGEYEKIDESQWSQLDMEVHEHPVLTGKIGVIPAKIDHQDFRGVNHYVAKHNEYSSWEAHRFLMTANDPEVRAAWTWKQKIKYRLIRSPLIGPIYFIGSFVVMGGFRDGGRGMAFAILKMAYFTQVYCKIREMEETSHKRN